MIRSFLVWPSVLSSILATCTCLFGEEPLDIDGIGAYFWSEVEQQYVVYFRIGEKVPGLKRSVARATSKDLLTWSEPVPMTFGDTPRENLYENMTAPYFRAPHLYVALATRFMEGRKGIMHRRKGGPVWYAAGPRGSGPLPGDGQSGSNRRPLRGRITIEREGPENARPACARLNVLTPHSDPRYLSLLIAACH